MQKWWLIGAGVLGIALAVLLIPSPQTGDDPVAAAPVIVRPGVDIAEPVAGADPIAERRERRRALREPNGPNPIAKRLAARRDVPEGRHAAKAGPAWTEIRRQLAKQRGETPDPTLDALVEKADAMADKMTALRRNPQGYDWSEVEAEQKALLAEISSSKYGTGEITEYLDLAGRRIDEYYEDKTKTEAAKAGTAEPVVKPPGQ